MNKMVLKLTEVTTNSSNNKN